MPMAPAPLCRQNPKHEQVIKMPEFNADRKQRAEITKLSD